MNFGEAFEQVKQGKAMRLPNWQPDVSIKAQFPDENSKMTAPYLYVESRFGRVPWKETMIELFAETLVILTDIGALFNKGNVFEVNDYGMGCVSASILPSSFKII